MYSFIYELIHDLICDLDEGHGIIWIPVDTSNPELMFYLSFNLRGDYLWMSSPPLINQFTQKYERHANHFKEKAIEVNQGDSIEAALFNMLASRD